jgi:hypothetical protein
MAMLSTGPIENSPVNSVRPTQQVTVKIDNRDFMFEKIRTQELFVMSEFYRACYLRIIFISAQRRDAKEISKTRRIVCKKILGV